MTASKKSGLGARKGRLLSEELLFKNSTLCDPCEKYAVTFANPRRTIYSQSDHPLNQSVFKANFGLKALALQSKASERSIAWRRKWVLNVFFPVLRFQALNLEL
jgi:hypothetical protein